MGSAVNSIFNTCCGNKSAKPSNSDKQQAVNYLNRSVEDISEKTENYYRMLKGLNLTAAVVTGTVVLVAVTVGSIAIGLFAPEAIIAIPFVSMAIAGVAISFIKQRLAKAINAEHIAETCKKIRSIEKKIPTNTPQLVKKLNDLGITPSDIKDSRVKDNISKLRPLIAHYEYWHNLAKDFEKQSQKLRDEQAEHLRKFPSEIEEVNKMRISSIASGESALICKTKAAFYLGLLKNPRFSKEMNETILFNETVDSSDISQDIHILGKRALAEHFGDLRERNILKINQSGNKSTVLTHDQLKSISERNLSAMIFA
ncbi:MAG: hypothetical protein FJZ57_02085 [Chlamydiae bacterium]|nr:hypothetical protein [Chlamydiota bacterium]